METVTTRKPWGSFTRFTLNEVSTVKILHINKGEEFSLQYHASREEFWKVLKGNPEIIIGDEKYYPKEGEEFLVKKGEKHRVSAPTDDVAILEISKGEFDESD